MLSEVEAVSFEVKSGTDTTISCVITGLGGTEAAAVSWIDSDTNEAVAGDDFVAVAGTRDADVAGKQTTTLRVKPGQVDEDKTYTCQVTSGALTDSEASSTTVNLDVYG